MKLKISIGLFIIGLLLFGWVEFVYFPKMEEQAAQEQAEMFEPETHHFGEIMDFENPYMGNASNNMNLVNHLPMSDVPRMFQQDPDEFKLTVNYEESVKVVGKERVEKSILYNASAIFALIKNMEVVEFSFPDQTYIITRQRVNGWFGKDVALFNEEKIFMKNVQQPIKEKRQLDEWFAAYTKGEI